MNALNVLVVDDSIEFRELVMSVARGAGDTVLSAMTIEAALESLETSPPDLILLDLGLPDGDGLDLCAKIRESSNAYILMVSGRDTMADKIEGFERGADDYVTKPFSARELRARIDALARRPRPAQHRTEMTFDDLVIRPETREVELGGDMVPLTRTEFDILHHLARHPGVVHTRDDLRSIIWGDNWFGVEHGIDVHVGNLRRKLGRFSDRPFIRTVRGVGFGFSG